MTLHERRCSRAHLTADVRPHVGISGDPGLRTELTHYEEVLLVDHSAVFGTNTDIRMATDPMMNQTCMSRSWTVTTLALPTAPLPVPEEVIP